MTLPEPTRIWLCQARLHFTTLPSQFCLVCGKPMVAYIVEDLGDNQIGEVS